MSPAALFLEKWMNDECMNWWVGGWINEGRINGCVDVEMDVRLYEWILWQNRSNSMSLKCVNSHGVCE